MASTTFFIPSVNIMGAGSLVDAMKAIQAYGFKHALSMSLGGAKCFFVWFDQTMRNT